MSLNRERAALLAECHDDPVLFALRVLRIFLRPWQLGTLEEIRERLMAGETRLRVLIRSCHGSGKTYLAAIVALWWMATRPQARGLTLAPTWRAVESILWPEIRRLYAGSLLADLGVGRMLTTELEFGPAWLVNGAASDRPEHLEGAHSPTAALRVVDEAKAVPSGVFDATDGLLTSPEALDLWISTPSIPEGRFYERDVNGSADVIRRVVTVDDLIAEGVPGVAEWKDERLREWGEASPEYQSRALARYISDAEGSLYPFSWVDAAIRAPFDVESEPIAGLDVAGSTDGDETALAIAAGPDEEGRFRVLEVIGWHERDTQKSRGRALEIARRHGARRLRIDVVGLGKGLSDSMRADELRVEEYRASDRAGDPTRFQNKKAEDAWRLRTLLEKGLVRLPGDTTLRAQMLAMKYEITAAGKIRVVDPSDSPDRCDAVLIALSRRGGLNAAWLDMLHRREEAIARGEDPNEPDAPGPMFVGSTMTVRRDPFGGELDERGHRVIEPAKRPSANAPRDPSQDLVEAEVARLNGALPYGALRVKGTPRPPAPDPYDAHMARYGSRHSR